MSILSYLCRKYITFKLTTTCSKAIFLEGDTDFILEQMDPLKNYPSEQLASNYLLTGYQLQDFIVSKHKISLTNNLVVRKFTQYTK